jgi:hypothetical protein
MQISPRPAGTARLSHFWREHGVALLIYLVLSVALTWPLVRDFTTALIGGWDARHHLWVLWHTKEAILGHEPLFHTSLLYYPYGLTLLTHSLGPLMGLLALPFWAWGPEAAYNGAVLVGFLLTGYCMYLLARGLGFERSIALFAGTVFLVAPRHLAAIYGHLTKVFLGLVPLVLLALHHALDPERSGRWAVAAAFALLLALLHSAEQFVFAGLAIGFFLIVVLLETEPAHRWFLVRRGALIAVSTLILTGPFLIAILVAASNPAIFVGRNLESFQHQPDLIQFLLPVGFSRILGPAFARFLQPYTQSPAETAVFIGWTSLLLCSLALISGSKPARRWLLFAVVCVLFALGPSLKVLGKSSFTEYQLPIILPYALLTALPGFDFIRAPGRFMLTGFVGFGIAASFGLAWLTHRAPSRLYLPIVLTAIVLVLLENWPQYWPQETLRPVPEFYQQIGRNDESYGVFDLPIRPYKELSFSSSHVVYSSYYQMYQMTHGKGIAAGYLSRYYNSHPFLSRFMNDSLSSSPLQGDLLVNGSPTDPYANVGFELANRGYRYVVYHKPQDWYPEYKEGSWGESVSQDFVEKVFGEQAPLVHDELVKVYALNPFTTTEHLTTTMTLGANWRPADPEWRWATSPATVYLTSPRRQLALLEIVPAHIHSPESSAGPGLGNDGVLDVQVDHDLSSVEIGVGQRTEIPILVSEGSQPITLSLQAGNYQPTDYGQAIPAELSFAVRNMNLRTLDSLVLPAASPAGSEPALDASKQIIVGFGGGWYDLESLPDVEVSWRWAMSPSELLIYSYSPQSVQLELTPASFHDPDSPDGVGSQGMIIASVNHESPQRFAAYVGQPFTVNMALHEGFNRMTLALEAGNLRPSDVQPGNGDQRLLSFALGKISKRR